MLPALMKRSVSGALSAAVLVLAALTGSTAATGHHAAFAAQAGWVWPVDAPHIITRPYIAPETAYSAGHRGIDLAAPVGAVVRSPADGTVHFSGFIVDRFVVSIDHGDGIITSFEPVLSELPEGAAVQRGEPIGTVQPGHCASSCVHFGVRLHGQYVSPLNYLGGLEPSVLLPTRPLP